MREGLYELHEDNTALLKEIHKYSKTIKAVFDKAAASDDTGACASMSGIMRVLLLTQEAQIMQEKRLVELEASAGGKRIPVPPGFH
jgi:hypothetical protein